MKLNVLGNCQEKSEIESCPEDTKRNAFGNCQATPTCDKGKLNVFGDCESKISISCPSGSTTVAGICEKKASCEKRTKITGICIDYECDSGWKQVVSICTKSPSKSCPSGMKIKGLVCAKSPDCPTGTSLNDIGVCIGKQERSCPSGLTPNAAGYCTKEPTCLKDWTYNEVTNRCEKAPDFPGEGLLDPCPEYSRSGEKEWKDAGYRYGWSEYNSRCVEDEPTCLQYDENSEQDPWEILDDKENARFPGDECILQLCKLPEEHPNWIEKSRCDVQGTSSSPNNLVELPDGSPEIKNPDENKIVQGYSLSGYVFENPDKITPEEINEIYQNDEQFRDWISENSPGTSIENVIEELNESYEILDDSSSEPDIDSTIEPDNNSANKPDTDVLPNTKLDKEIPEWIKDQSEWWVSGAISDREFIDLFEYLIENEIINVPNLPEPEQVGKAPIPSWFKNNVRWWNTGQVTDFDFAKGLEHLVKIGVIVIQKN
jgi:hypothetical protein